MTASSETISIEAAENRYETYDNKVLWANGSRFMVESIPKLAEQLRTEAEDSILSELEHLIMPPREDLGWIEASVGNPDNPDEYLRLRYYLDDAVGESGEIRKKRDLVVGFGTWSPDNTKEITAAVSSGSWRGAIEKSGESVVWVNCKDPGVGSDKAVVGEWLGSMSVLYRFDKLGEVSLEERKVLMRALGIIDKVAPGTDRTDTDFVDRIAWNKKQEIDIPPRGKRVPKSVVPFEFAPQPVGI